MKFRLMAVALLTAALIVAGAGCHSAPKQVVENGVVKAEDKAKGDTDSLINSAKQHSVKAVLAATPKALKQTLNLDKNALKIDATVTVPALSTLSEVVVKPASMNIDKLKSVCFGSNASKAQIAQDSKNKQKVDSSFQNVYQYETGGGLTSFFWNATTGQFEYSVGQAPLMESSAIASNGTAPSCQLSNSDAKAGALAFMQSLDRKDFRFKNITAYGPEGDTQMVYRRDMGYYAVELEQIVEGLPVGNREFTITNSGNKYKVGANSFLIIIDDKGIQYAGGGIWDEVSQKEINSILSLQDAVNILGNNLGGVTFSDQAPFKTIALEFVPEQRDAGITLVPCWHFYVDATNASSVTTKDKNGVATTPEDIYIDAQTGGVSQ